jgi:hypothetical protein
MKDLDTPDIDLREIDLRDIDLRDIDLRADDAESEDIKDQKSFSWTGLLGGLTALGWAAGACAAAVSYFGLDILAELHPALQAGLAAIAFGPAILIWLGASAAAEATHARRLAMRMEARTAKTVTLTSEDEEAARTQRQSVALRSEIDDLNAAVEEALSRLGEIEINASRNIAAFENAISVGGQGAGALNALMERERAAMTALNAEFRSETETLARNVSRQIRLIQEASKLFKSETANAEAVMTDQAHRFNDAAEALSERTAAMHAAADAAEQASGRLDDSLSSALENLNQATSLNDASRDSAEAAAAAANAVAGAVREVSVRAVNDVRKVAQMVREESAAIEDVAGAALARLREAADAARLASEDSQAAADRHASAIEKRLGALAETAKVARRQPAPATVRTQAFVEDQPISAAAGSGRATSMSFAKSAPAASRFANRFSGDADWNNLLPDDPDALHLDVANERGNDPFGLSEANDPDAALVQSALEVCSVAGIRLSEALGPEDMERIASRARFGASARRRAVSEAAPASVQRLNRHLRRTAQAKTVAMEFRARPELAKVNRRGQNADVIVAYLMLDAALV